MTQTADLTGTTRVEWRASAAFPVEPREQFAVRDGRGRVVEVWRVASVSKGDSSKWITFDVKGHRAVSDL